MANEDKKGVIAKIIKLFLEFLIAALVAWFGGSCVRNYKAPLKCLVSSVKPISAVALLPAKQKIYGLSYWIY